MLALLEQSQRPIVADDAEAAIAKKAAERLRAVAEADQDIQVIVSENPRIVVPLPARAVRLIFDVLVNMANRTPISIIPHEAELTTQQAADFLNVSRPFLCQLVDQGRLKSRKVGTHRRVMVADLLAYKERAQAEGDAASREMADISQSLNLD